MVAFGPLLDRLGGEYVIHVDRGNGQTEKCSESWSFSVVFDCEGLRIRVTYEDIGSSVIEVITGEVLGTPVHLERVHRTEGTGQNRKVLMDGSFHGNQSDLVGRLKAMLPGHSFEGCFSCARKAPSRRRSPSGHRRPKAG